MENVTRHLRRYAIHLFASMLIGATTPVAFAQEFERHRGDDACPGDLQLATAAIARANVQRACQALETWSIARLAGGGSMDGPGYACKIRDFDGRALGDSLCMRRSEPRFMVQAGDGQCPPDRVLASAHQVRDATDAACGALGPWFIARLADGGSMDGSGYGCKVRDTDARDLGHSLCIKGRREDYGHGTNCIADTLLPDIESVGGGESYAWLHDGIVQGRRYAESELQEGLADPVLANQAAESYCKSNRYDWFSAHDRSHLPDAHLDVQCCSKLSTRNSLVSPQLLQFTDRLQSRPAEADALLDATDPDQLFHIAKDLGYGITKSELTALLGHSSDRPSTRLRSAGCGDLGQPPCAGCVSEVTVYWPFNFCCIPMHAQCIESGPVSHCKAGMAQVDGVCRIYRARWEETKIDPSRGLCDGINCWQHDDQIRDRLEMDTSKLNFVSVLDEDNNRIPQDGRYIYVYRKSDNKIVLRHYDRDPKDEAFAYPGNCRAETDFGNFPCALEGGVQGRSLHVRHSQLNGGWDPVWCAGEMRIEDGKICLINNESGHFKPDASCTYWVRRTLKIWDVPTAAYLLDGKLSEYKAAQSCASQHRDEL